MKKPWYRKLLSSKSEIEKYIVNYVPCFGDKSTDVKILQKALNDEGANLVIDGDYGPKTKRALSVFQISKGLYGSGSLGPKTLSFLNIKYKHGKPFAGSKTPWFWRLKKLEGKKETNSKFNKKMSAKWNLVGLNLGTISKNWAAWCGLFIAVGLSGVGYQWQKDGATAKNWDKYGQKIEWKVNGFPQGAIIRINHKSKCKSASGNHVTLANGSCSAKDLNKSAAMFSGYGGNQGNMAKVSIYPVEDICSVRWPKEQPLPKKVLKSINCSNGKTNLKESTQ